MNGLPTAASKRWVPLICLHDDSAFGVEADRFVQVMRPEAAAAICLNGNLKETARVLDPLFETGFLQQIGTLVLHDHEPWWCVWFLSCPLPQDIDALVQAVDERRPDGIQHVFVIESDPGAAPGALLALPATRLPHYRCLLTCNGDLHRTTRQLAAGAGAWITSGWLRFCAKPEESVRKVLWLPTDGPEVVTLGIGVGEPDARYHGIRWADRLGKDLRKLWMDELVTEPSPSFTRLRELIAILLPKEHYALLEEPTEDGASLRTTQEQVTLVARSPRVTIPSHAVLRGRRYWDWLLVLRNRFHELTFLRLPQLRQFVRTHAPLVETALREQVDRACELPKEPGSLLYRLRQKLDHALLWLQSLSTVAGETASAGNFEGALVGLQQRVSRLPDSTGLLARLSLIAVGLIWLVVGPVVWQGPIDFLKDPVLRETSFYAGAALLLVVMGAGGHLLLLHWQVMRDFHRTERDLLRRHLAEAAGVVGEVVRTQAGARIPPVVTWQGDLGRLSAELRKPVKAADPGVNATPFINDNGVDRNIERDKGSLLSRTHQGARSALLEPGWPGFETARWEAALTAASATVAGCAVSGLRFDACVESSQRSPTEREKFFDNLVRETRQLCWVGVPGACRAPVCFGSLSWQQHQGVHDTTEFYSLGYDRALMMTTAASVHA